MSPNMRGAVLMMASMAAFTFNDACLKALSDEVPLFQAILLRGAGTTVILLAMAWYGGAFKVQIERHDRWLVMLRTGAEVAASYLFITALFHMPLANISAILQALPLTVTLASALVFREAVGWRRLSAILVGFAGVLLIVQPGEEGFNFYSIYAIAAVLVVTFRDLAARRLSQDVPSLSVALAASIGVTLFGALGTVGGDWVAVSPKAAAQLGGATLFIVGGYLFSVMAMRVGEIGFVAPFRYTSLLVALVLGFVAFGDWPDNLTLIGAGVVVATGVFTLYRERRLARSTGPVPLRSR